MEQARDHEKPSSFDLNGRGSLSLSPDNDSQFSDNILLLDESRVDVKSTTRRRLKTSLVYALISILWILSLLFVALLVSSDNRSLGSFDAGFDTDLGELSLKNT
jgi:hypothetical protein